LQNFREDETGGQDRGERYDDEQVKTWQMDGEQFANVRGLRGLKSVLNK